MKTISLLALCAVTQVYAALPVALDLATQATSKASSAWPAMPPQPLPKGLRPCCAFGYNLHAELLGMPVPFYQLDNVAYVSHLGQHQYNDKMLAGLENLTGLSGENNGILYTARGGFIDTAHVRDTADMTVYIFSQLLPRLGQAFTLDLESELAQRRLVFTAFIPPTDPAERYTLAAWLAAHLAYQVAEWHEIAQWYGFESVPGFSEGVSAFSPEDLYSNLLGARLAVSLILDGQTVSQGVYNAAMGTALSQALMHLGAQPPAMTRFHFDMLDGRWWNSLRRVPEKYLVLHRNFQMGDNRLPTRVPGEQNVPQRLTLPHRWQGITLADLGQLQLWPGASMKQLPPPARYYTAEDFSALAASAQQADAQPRR
ncbi:DUF4056 domain-containing protein [Kluyvera sichuanensis]